MINKKIELPTTSSAVGFSFVVVLCTDVRTHGCTDVGCSNGCTDGWTRGSGGEGDEGGGAGVGGGHGRGEGARCGGAPTGAVYTSCKIYLIDTPSGNSKVFKENF